MHTRNECHRTATIVLVYEWTDNCILTPADHVKLLTLFLYTRVCQSSHWEWPVFESSKLWILLEQTSVFVRKKTERKFSVFRVWSRNGKLFFRPCRKRKRLEKEFFPTRSETEKYFFRLRIATVFEFEAQKMWLCKHKLLELSYVVRVAFSLLFLPLQ